MVGGQESLREGLKYFRFTENSIANFDNKAAPCFCHLNPSAIVCVPCLSFAVYSIVLLIRHGRLLQRRGVSKVLQQHNILRSTLAPNKGRRRALCVLLFDRY